MSQSQSQQASTSTTSTTSSPVRPHKVLKFLNDYRKQLALIKTKSFYANHLCRIKCIQNRLYENNSDCLSECDNWLDKFYEFKQKKNPETQGKVMLSSETFIEQDRRLYEKKCATCKMGVKNYLVQLDTMLNDKISQSTNGKKRK